MCVNKLWVLLVKQNKQNVLQGKNYSEALSIFALFVLFFYGAPDLEFFIYFFYLKGNILMLPTIKFKLR